MSWQKRVWPVGVLETTYSIEAAVADSRAGIGESILSMNTPPSVPFVQTDIACSSGAEAEAEARAQRAREPDQAAIEWIYLHNDDGDWVARRTLRYGGPPLAEEPRSRLRMLGDALLALLSWH